MTTVSGTEPYFSFKTKTLGELFAFHLLHSNKKELRTRLGGSIEKSTPLAYVRTLITISCHTRTSLIDGRYRPSVYSLAAAAANEVTVEELEAFSSLYLEHNDYLYTGNEIIPNPNKDESEIKLLIKQGSIVYPRKDNESNVDYLYRISVAREKEESAQAQEAMKTLGMTSFSSGLQEQIRTTLNMGAMLKDTSISPGHSAQFDRESASDIFKTMKQQEDARLKPFRALSGKLDELVELSSSTADFMVEMNKTQTTIAAELKASGQTTTWFAKANFVSSILIILLTLVSLWLGYQSFFSNDTVAHRQLEYANKIVKNLDDINNHSMLSSKHADASLEKLIEQQTAFLRELKDIRLQEEKRLEFLLKRAKEEK